MSEPRSGSPRGVGGGEADLWAAVVERAFADACGGDGRQKCEGPDAASAWLFLTGGENWAHHRNWIAALMGSDGAIIRQEAIRRGPSRYLRAYWLRQENPSKPVKRKGRKAVAAARSLDHHTAEQHVLHAPLSHGAST